MVWRFGEYVGIRYDSKKYHIRYDSKKYHINCRALPGRDSQ